MKVNQKPLLTEAAAKINLNIHCKDVNNPKAIPACIHFRKEGHNFIEYAKFTLIKQLNETENVSKATLKLPLKLTEDF